MNKVGPGEEKKKEFNISSWTSVEYWETRFQLELGGGLRAGSPYGWRRRGNVGNDVGSCGLISRKLAENSLWGSLVQTGTKQEAHEAESELS